MTEQIPFIEELKEYVEKYDEIDEDPAEALLKIVSKYQEFELVSIIEGRLAYKEKLQKVFYDWPIGVFVKDNICFVVDDKWDIIIVLKKKND